MKENLDRFNVVIINDFDYVQGGASKVAIDTANLLAQDGFNVYFFSAIHNDETSLDHRIISVCTNQFECLRDRNKIRGIMNGIYNFTSKKKLKKLLKTLNREDTIVHVHGWTKGLSCSIFDILFQLHFKFVLTLHDYFTACPNGGYFNYKNNIICHFHPLSISCIKCNCDSRNYLFKIYRLLRQFVQNKIVRVNSKLENVIAISDFSINILKKTLPPSTHVYRVNNPIDVEISSLKPDLKRNTYYLYVGRVSKEKGVDIFCKAITDLGLEGVVVGDGDEKNILQSKYPNIDFVGWKNHNEVKAYMFGAKAFIFPSQWYETAGLTILEALFLGIPWFASDCSAGRDYVPSDNWFSDVDDLKQKILRGPVKSTFQDIQSFSKEHYLKLMCEVYLDILNKK